MHTFLKYIPWCLWCFIGPYVCWWCITWRIKSNWSKFTVDTNRKYFIFMLPCIV